MGGELNTLFEQAGFLDLAQPTDLSYLLEWIDPDDVLPSELAPQIIIVLRGEGTKHQERPAQTRISGGISRPRKM